MGGDTSVLQDDDNDDAVGTTQPASFGPRWFVSFRRWNVGSKQSQTSWLCSRTPASPEPGTRPDMAASEEAPVMPRAPTALQYQPRAGC